MRAFRILPLFAVATASLFLGACTTSGSSYPVRTYQLGEKVDLGHIIYTAFETQWLTQLGTGPAARIPQSRYFLVRFSAVNSGASELIVPNLTIQDDKGQTYSELSNGEGVLQWAGFLRQVKPAESVTGNVVFDAPPAHYKLRVTDENGDRTAFIDIPLSFGAETPEVPTPEGKK
jgi:hypothetical protein